SAKTSSNRNRTCFGPLRIRVRPSVPTPPFRTVLCEQPSNSPTCFAVILVLVLRIRLMLLVSDWKGRGRDPLHPACQSEKCFCSEFRLIFLQQMWVNPTVGCVGKNNRWLKRGEAFFNS